MVQDNVDPKNTDPKKENQNNARVLPAFPDAKQSMALPEIYSGYLSGFPKTEKNPINLNKVSGRKSLSSVPSLYDNMFENSSIDTNTHGKIIDLDNGGSKIDLNIDEWQDVWNTGDGFFGHIYRKRLNPRVTEGESNWKLLDDISDYAAMYNDDEVYVNLVSYVDPETGRPILAKITGTDKQLKERNLTPFNKWGLPEDDDSVWGDVSNLALNVAGDTPDFLIGMASYLYEGMNLATPDAVKFNDPVYQFLEKATQVHEQEKLMNEFLISKSSEKAWSPNWFATGLTNAVLSTGQFGLYGRAIGMTGKGANAIAGAFGKEALKQASINQVSRYGASGIMGFGYGFNEAAAAGLSEGERFSYATLVGGINSAIEIKLGKQFDEFLVGGGVQAAAKELIQDKATNMTGKGAQKYFAEKMLSVPAGILGKAKTGASEAAEEALQSVVEQGFKLAFNYGLKGEAGNEKGEGLFEIDEFSFAEIGTSAMFGFLAPIPFRGSSQYARAFEAAANGKSKEVRQNLSELAAKGKITPKKYQKAQADFDKIEEQARDYSKIYDRFTGEDRNFIIKALAGPIQAKVLYSNEIDKRLKELGDVDLEDVSDKAQKAKKFIEDRRKKITEINKEIDKFEDPNHTDKLLADFKEKKKAMWDARNNAFDLMATLSEYSQYEEVTDEGKLVEQIQSQPVEFYKEKSSVRTPGEAALAMNALRSGKLDLQYHGAVINDAVRKGFLFSDKVNTAENQPFFAAAFADQGDDTGQSGLKKLPLTSSEKEGLANGQEAQFTEDRLMNPETIRAMLASEENLNDAVAYRIKTRFGDGFEAVDEGKKEAIKAEIRAELAADEARQSFYRMNAFLTSNKGAAIGSLSGLDNTKDIMALLSPAQSKAFEKINRLNGITPTVMMNPGKGSKFYGVFDASKNFIAVSGDFTRLQELAAKEKPTPEQKKELKALRADLFHKLVHEFGGHSYLDKALTHLHGAYMDSLAGNRERDIEAQYFQRMLKLAELSYYAMLKNPKANGFYFMAVAKQYMAATDLKQKATLSLVLVKEFMAESSANGDMQAVLSGFDLNDPKHNDLVQSVYSYKQAFKSGKKSIWSEVVDALSSIFSYFKDVFTREERTLLTEALHLGAGADFDQYASGANKRTLQVSDVSELTISNYDGVNLFEGEAGVSPEQIANEIISRLNDRGINLISKNSFIQKLGEYLDTIVQNDGRVIVEDSMTALFFQKTDTFMLTWKYADQDGNETRQRTFFNTYGEEVFINTNPRNSSAPLTIQKHLFKTFELADSDPNKANQVELINNVRRAAKENFYGKVHFELDENHVWKLGKETITSGQVKVIYTFQDSEESVIIGYTHDLSKVRLARYLKRGVKLTGYVTPESEKGSLSEEGSMAYMKLDGDEIVDMMQLTNPRWESLSTEEQSQYTRGRTFNPALNFYFDDNIEIDSSVQDEANSIDTITTQDESVEPKVSSKDLSAYERILQEGITDDFYEENLFLSFFSPSQWDLEANTPGQVANFHQTAVLRSVMFNAIVMKAFDSASMGKLVNNAVKAIQAKLDTKSPMPNLGFDSEQELTEFKEFVVSKVYERFRTERDIAPKDAQDWSDRGSNPSGRISEAIKVAFESEAYEWDGAQYFVDYSEAEDILFPSSKGTTSTEEMAVNVKRMIDEGDFIGRHAKVAQAVYNHLIRDRSVQAPHQLYWEKARKSYWSQFYSIKRLDAVIQSAKHKEDPDGLGAHMRYASEFQMIMEKENEIVGKLQKRFSEIKAKAAEQKLTTKEVLNNEMDAFYKEKLGSRFSEDLLQTKAKTKSTLRNLIAPIKNAFTAQKMNTVSTAVKSFKAGTPKEPSEIVDGILKFSPEYSLASEKLTVALEYFDIQIPPALLAITENAETKNRIQEMLDYNASAAEIREAVSTMPYNNVNMVAFELKDQNGKTSYGRHPMISLVASMLDWNLKSIETNSAKPFGEKTNRELAKQLLKHEGNNRTPKFYLNTEMQKEYAYKTKNNTDELFEKLEAKNSELLKRYKSSPKYRYNTVLDAIVESNGEPIESFMVGLNSFHESNNSATFESAGDLDFLYMHLNGFAAPANAANNSNYYYHVEDVPSDKPKNYLYRLIRIDPAAFKGEVKKIIELESERLKAAEAKFAKAFNADGMIKDRKEFDKLVPDVHYSFKEDGTFGKGWLFDKKNSFYESKNADQILKQITEESENSYVKWTSQGLQIPLSPRFVRDLNRQEFTPDQLQEKIEGEQKRLYKEWYFNYTINRYHLSMLTMGDYIFYKPKDFIDLNKRMAGTRAPFARALWNRAKIDVAIINDVGITDNEVKEESIITVPKLKGIIQPDGKTELFGVSGSSVIVSRRTDAQGYVTEQFAAEIIEAYGSLAGYEKIFKPVMFGVSEDNIDEAQPLYVKLSLAVMLDPGNPKNDEYYANYPKQEGIAKRLYASKAQFAVFNSGIKVGANTLNNLMTEIDPATDEPIPYKITSFDSNLFGMQNNPYHNPDSDENVINGLLQITKQFGDNHPDNKAKMERYHEIEARLIEHDINNFFSNEMKDVEGIRSLVHDNLGDEEFAKAIKDFMAGDVNVLDSPVLAKYSENILNAIVKSKTRLYKKHGEKLVNISDLGFGRPMLSEPDNNYRLEVLENVFNVSPHLIKPYNEELMWLGPRSVQDMNITQLKAAINDLAEEKIYIGEGGYIYTSDGNVKIFPAEVLVPPTSNYQLGSRTIGVRIPTSKKGSAVPGEVVGFISDDQGNGIVYGKHGTGVLGFDFDVDGMFTWRETTPGGSYDDKYIQEIFDIGFEILTAPRNYNEMISPVSTDTLGKILKTMEEEVTTKKTEATQIVKETKVVPGETKIIDDMDLLSFAKKLEAGSYPLEFFTYNTIFKAFMTPGTGTWQKAPGSAVWRLNPDTRLYDMIDVETGETHYENVDLATGTQNTIETFEREIKITPDYKFSKFSPDRQIEAKKSNGDGKDLISVFASYSGIHSVFAQYGVSFMKGNYYNFNGEKLTKHEEHTLAGELITDLISELLNGAADNAKLQLLSKLGITKVTAPVLLDMIAHGMPLEYSIWFINQPAIKEYMRLKENQSAASFKGEKSERLFESVEQSLISKAQETNPEFAFKSPIFKNKSVTKEEDEIDDVDSKDFSVVRAAGKLFDMFKKGQDNVFIEEGELKASLNKSFDELSVEQINSQLVILNKFRHYGNLSRLTSKAGKIIQMASSFPKTFIELTDAHKKVENIYDSKQINVRGVYQHPYYKMIRSTIKNMVDRYAEFKIYAKPEIIEYHNKVTVGVSLEGQQKLVDDFYSYILTGQKESNNSANVFNLSTTSLAGTEVNPWDFVHESAKAVSQMKKEFPDNEFLKLLKIVPGPKSDQDVLNRSTEPDYISSMLNYELDAKQLSDVRKGFDMLPENFTYTYRDTELNQDVPVTIKSSKDLVLGHLLHTKGMTLGGFSFSKILPVEVVRSFDNSVKGTIVSPDMIEEFFYQSSYNNREMVKEVTEEDMAVIKGSQHSKIEGIKGGNGVIKSIKFTIYGAEPISIEKQKLMKVIKIKGPDGAYRFYEAAKIVGKNLNVYEYKLIEYSPARNVKFYDIVSNPTRMKSFNESVDRTNATDALLEEEVNSIEDFNDDEQGETFDWNKITPNQKVDVTALEATDFISLSGLPMKTFNTVDLDLVATEIEGKDSDRKAIMKARKTALSVLDASENVLSGIKKDDLIRIKLSDGFLLVRAKKDSYAIADVSAGVDEQKLIDTWAGYQDVDPETITMDTIRGLRQLQFQYVASTSDSGKIVHESKDATDYEAVQRVRRKYDEAITNGLTEEEAVQYAKC